MGFFGDIWTGVKHIPDLPKTIAGGAASDPGAATEKQRKEQLYGQAQHAGNFANQGETGYGQLSWEAAMERDRLRRLANGQDSMAGEQLRQGMQQNVAAQRSMAAGAAPGSAPMAARTAANNMARLGYGMSGQQAMAGIAERSAYAKALNDSIAAQRGQDINVALGSRGNALQGYGAGNSGTPEKSALEKYGPAVLGGIAMMSDERLKHEIEDGDSDADKAIKSLRAYKYKYKDEKYGKGEQFGIMAQDLERAGLKHAVIETPAGKAVDGAKLSAGNTAMIARLGQRLAALEGKKK